jgi:preprotein translocase subunit SecE
MAKVLDFFKDSYVEITEKVTWPTSAVIVLVASLLIALVVFVMDKASSVGLEFLYGIAS